MKSDERTFFVFNCETASATINAKLPHLKELVEVWQKYHQAGKVTQVIRKGSASLTLGDIQVDEANAVAKILVRLSDLKAPDAVYSDMGKGKFKQHTKVNSEGNDLGAHILLSLTPEKGKLNTYCALIEKVQGLNYLEIRRILNHVIHTQYQDDPKLFEIDDPRGGRTRDGKLKRVVHLPRIELQGHPSESLVSDLENGTLSSVVLIKTETMTPVMRAPFLRKQERQLRLSIDRDSRPTQLWKALKLALTDQAKEYPKAKISFKLADQKRAVSVTVDSASGAPVDDLYFRSVLLTGISPRLANSSQTLVAHLVDLALPHLLNSRKV